MPEPEIRRDPTVEELELILNQGRRFIPHKLPSDIKRWEPGKCFDACAVQSLYSKGKYGYVEGIALNPDDHSRWILHAWMTDGKYAYDPTWNATDDAGREQVLPTMYIGIAMDIEAVGRFMVATTYQGIIPNRWRNPALADIAIKSKVI